MSNERLALQQLPPNRESEDGDVEVGLLELA